MHYALTEVSGNSKIVHPEGPPVAVVTSDARTCPTACPLRGRECYASTGRFTRIHWDAVTERRRGVPFARFVAEVHALPLGSLFRYAVAGDLPGVGNRIAAGQLARLSSVVAARKLRAWSYTHKPVIGRTRQAAHNRRAIRAAVRAGFTINLSADSLAHADRLARLGIAPVAVTVPADTRANLTTPEGRTVMICPAVTRGRSCNTCSAAGPLCAIASPARVIIGFPAHGRGAASLSRRLTSEANR